LSGCMIEWLYDWVLSFGMWSGTSA